MKVQIPKKIKEVINKFNKKNFEIYIVGGAVRDMIMGKRVIDWDFATNAKPEEIMKIFPNSFYNNTYGTVSVPSEKAGERPLEITTFRKEFDYRDFRRPAKIIWGKTIQEDLKRRDFTINAMALKINKIRVDSSFLEAELIDIFEGQKDLENKIIRAVGNPQERFYEDALRMMRAIRIASELGFKIDEQTFTAIKSNVSLIHKVSNERIRDELIKILKSPHPYEGMILLKESSLLREILPELNSAFGVEQKSPHRHHIYDVGTHSFLSLKFVAERNLDPIVRLATLIHDIGKPKTFRKLEDGTITFYNHEVIGAKIAEKIAQRLRFSKKETDKLYRLVRFHQFSVDEKQTDSSIRRFIRKVGIENIPDIIDLRIADRLGGGAKETSWRLEEFKKRLIEVQKQPFSIKDLKIDGHDVMQILEIQPGPKVGEILRQIFKKVVEKKLPNERNVLIREIEKIKQSGK